MYIPRHIEQVIKDSARTFPAIVVSGPRQVGKTTTLQCLVPDASYTTLDRLDTLGAALADPERFLGMLPQPAIIDEVQYAPDLFRYLKIAIDSERGAKGKYYLTGSQRYHMMQGVDESLAGRVGLVEMLGLSLREILGDDNSKPFIPNEDYLMSRLQAATTEDFDVWEVIFRGDLPELYTDETMDAVRYYESYIDAYLRRDVRNIAQVGDLTVFNRFMALTALQHGQQLNKARLAAMVGVSVPTVTRWLSILEASNIIYLLKPFHANTAKRLVKTPKLYFLNSGLAARLCDISSAQQLESDRMAGVFYEGFVVAEVLKSHLNATGVLPTVYYYRDSNQNEIDLLIQKGIDLYPTEIKKASIAHQSDKKSFRQLDGLPDYRVNPGIVICNCHQPVTLGDGSWAYPVRMI